MSDNTYYSQLQIANAMGVDSGTVRKWIEQELLLAETASDGVTRHIHERELYLFLITHRDRYKLAKVNQEWFLCMLIDYALTRGGEFWNLVPRGVINREWTTEPWRPKRGRPSINR